MRVVVTGSAGLIGSRLVERLSARGDTPVQVDLRDPVCPIDILNPAALADAVSGADGLIHLAAVSRVAWGESHPRICDAVNVAGTRNVLAAVMANPRPCWVVHASSREIYGNASHMPVGENTKPEPVNRYGRSKLYAERCVLDAVREGLPAAVLRLSSVYGGRQDHPDRVVPALTLRALQGLQLSITGAETFFDFVHVEDTVDGVLAAADCLARERSAIPPTNLATGVATSLHVLAETVLSTTGSVSALQVVPAREFDVVGYCGATEQAMTLLDWKAKFTIQEGVADVAMNLQRFGPLEEVSIANVDPSCARLAL